MRSAAAPCSAGAASLASCAIISAIGHIDVRNFTRAHELIAPGEAAIAENWAAIAALA